MAYDLQTMQGEVLARGFDYLNDPAGLARVKRWLNDAMNEINDRPEGWPFLYSRVDRAVPATFTDLARVKSVQYEDRPLPFASYEWLLNEGVIGVTGHPTYYYVTENSGGDRIVNVAPTQAVTMTIGYLRLPPELINAADTPWMPDRFRPAIVEYAVAKGLQDKSNYQEADAARRAGDVIVAQMQSFYAFMPGGIDSQQLTYASEDW